MADNSIYPCGRISRRRLLHQAGGGFFGLAMGAIWAEAGEIQNVVVEPQLQPKARSVIFLFMCGGVSHIDTFDYKPDLEKFHGKTLEGKGENKGFFGQPGKVMKSPFEFQRHGQVPLAGM
jgi:hypothetical protein